MYSKLNVSFCQYTVQNTSSGVRIKRQTQFSIVQVLIRDILCTFCYLYRRNKGFLWHEFSILFEVLETKMKVKSEIFRKILDKAALIVIDCKSTGNSIQRTYTKAVLCVSPV